jgi:hypothetical protein
MHPAGRIILGALAVFILWTSFEDRLQRCIGIPASGRARAEGEREVSVEQIRELEKMTQELVAVARKLPHGPDRETVLQEIREFRAQISALKAKVPSPRSTF